MCMGRTHVLMTGVLATASANPLATHFLDRPMTAGEVIAFGAVTAGYGILPDLDHPQATLARVLGPVTKALATVVAAVSGGHRKGTHTIWMAALMVFLMGYLAVRWPVSEAIAVFVGLFLLAMVLRIGPKPRTGPAELSYAAVAALGTFGTMHFLPELWWLPWAVGFGVVGHILGDILTTEGVPIFYPLVPRLVIRLPILGRTDSTAEHVFAFLLAPAWLAVAYLAFFPTALA